VIHFRNECAIEIACTTLKQNDNQVVKEWIELAHDTSVLVVCEESLMEPFDTNNVSYNEQELNCMGVFESMSDLLFPECACILHGRVYEGWTEDFMKSCKYSDIARLSVWDSITFCMEAYDSFFNALNSTGNITREAQHECSEYCSKSNCYWTAQLSCPWDESDGTLGRAQYEFTAEYRCCCIYRQNVSESCGGPSAAWFNSMPLCPGDNIVNRMQDSGYSTCVEVIANPGGDMSATKCACVLLMDPTCGDNDLDVLSTCIYHESYDISAFDLWILCNDTYGLNFTYSI